MLLSVELDEQYGLQSCFRADYHFVEEQLIDVHVWSDLENKDSNL